MSHGDRQGARLASGEDAAGRLRALHGPRDGGGLLILANAGDALSARLVERAGAEAVATSSAVVAWSRGYPDGEALPVGELLAVVASMARVLTCPLSVDAERGHGDEPDVVAGVVARLVEAGAAGVNLEDGGGDPAVLAAKIRAVRERLGGAVVINARTCVAMPMHGGLVGEQMVDEVRRRGRLYAAAGADGLFVPWLLAPGEIEAVAEGVELPLNVLLDPRMPPVSELPRLGVRRLSAGVWPGLTAYTAAERAVRALLGGDVSALTSGERLTYPELNALFAAAR